jgi:tRNA threonylcarbamoyladenosine biosynthesis protein TsaE
MQELSFLYTLSHIGAAATRIISHAGDRKIWLLTGDMGAGKTTLIKAISLALGAAGDFSSPTYSIANEYALGNSSKKIFHLDLYRLKSLQEAMDIGIEDYLFGGGYCLVEWPQLIMPLLRPKEFITIHLTSISEIERKVSIFI